MSYLRLEFDTDLAAERVLKNAGFSIGQLQRSDPRGVLFGEFVIAKWRNLTQAEKDGLDGQLVRFGPPGSPACVILHKPEDLPKDALSSVESAARNSEIQRGDYDS